MWVEKNSPEPPFPSLEGKGRPGSGTQLRVGCSGAADQPCKRHAAVRSPAHNHRGQRMLTWCREQRPPQPRGPLGQTWELRRLGPPHPRPPRLAAALVLGWPCRSRSRLEGDGRGGAHLRREQLSKQPAARAGPGIPRARLGPLGRPFKAPGSAPARPDPTASSHRDWLSRLWAGLRCWDSEGGGALGPSSSQS